MKTLVSVLLMLASTICHAQEIGPAALAFSERNPIAADDYLVQAKSYLVVHDGLVAKLPEKMQLETEIRSREFAAFTAGLFASYTSEQTLSCLSWQSLEDVTLKHALLTVRAEKLTYPVMNALVALKFACFTKQETDEVLKAFNAQQADTSAGQR